MNRQTGAVFYLVIEALLLLFFITWCSIRIFTIDVTNDEAFSFALLFDGRYKEILFYANTHWLNSFFMQLESFLPVEGFWKYRLHMLPAIFFFAYFSFRLASRLKLQQSRIFFLFFLLANPFICDFFSLARGYGWMLTGLMASLHYLAEYFDTESKRTVAKLSVWICIALLANYTIAFFAVGLAIFLLPTLKKINSGNKRILWPYIILLVLIPLSFFHLWLIKASGDLNYGAETIGKSLASLSGSIACGENFFLSTVYSIVLFAFAVIPAVYFAYRWFKIEKKFAGLVSLLFLFALVAVVSVHFIFGTPYPADRTWLPFICCGVICIAFFMDERVFSEWRVGFGILILAAILIPSSIIYYRAYNLERTSVYGGQTNNAPLFAKLKLGINCKNKSQALFLDQELYGIYENYYRKTDPCFKEIQSRAIAWPAADSLEARIFKAWETLVLVSKVNGQTGYKPEPNAFLFWRDSLTGAEIWKRRVMK
jgi:hypothetical protein